jgi:hypothetical protein
MFRKSLGEQIPKLNNEIDQCMKDTDDEMFLKPTTNIFEILRRLDALETQFKTLEQTATKYNEY